MADFLQFFAIEPYNITTLLIISINSLINSIVIKIHSDRAHQFCLSRRSVLDSNWAIAAEKWVKTDFTYGDETALVFCELRQWVAFFDRKAAPVYGDRLNF